MKSTGFHVKSAGFHECELLHHDHVISGFLQLLWMLYCSCIILCLCCNINKMIKSFCFLLFNVYLYSLSTATVTMKE